jgi:D-alanyl-D-alanine carboxypeptidase (penicillin-binding protein 5/6)
MTNSSFTNSSGLPDAEHLMSAHDLALLSQRIINHFPQHYAIYGEREFTYNEIRQPNRNTLLFRDQNVDGMKTGYTEEAGYCLVASAKRDDMRLIAVVLGTASTEARATEAQKLMTYGFRFYETRQLLTAGQQLTSQKIWGGNTNAVNIGVPEDVVVTIPRAAADSLETVLEVDEIIKAPIEAGQVMGTVRVTSGEEVLYEGPVVALEAVEKGSIFKRLMDWLHLFFLGLFS